MSPLPASAPSPGWRLRRVLSASVLGLSLVVAPLGTAAAVDPAPGSLAVGSVSAAAPSAEELEAQRGQTERLQAEARAQQAAVAEGRARLEQLSGQAGAALERYQAALAERDAAEAERLLQEERLAVARAVLAGNRADLGRWASRAYKDGGAMAQYEGLMTLLESDSSDDLSQRLSMLEHVGRARGSAVTTAKDAEATQRDATARSQAAARAATEAAARAEAAKVEADTLLEQQRAQLAQLNELLAATSGQAAQAASVTAQMELAFAAAEQRKLAAVAKGSSRGGNAVTGPVGTCAGADISGYGNGAIPRDALCPLAVAPNHRLRADAAFAFDQLAAAYTRQFGTPICITDSYRTLGSQVSLFAAKPNLAAVPGTSNHGWARAVDLCGGIEKFGTQQYQWMRSYAPLYGWFHPAWAQPGGSRPEPWHWEFGG